MEREKLHWRRLASLEAHLAVIAAPDKTWTADDFDPFHREPAPVNTFNNLLTYIEEANRAFGGEDLRKRKN